MNNLYTDLVEQILLTNDKILNFANKNIFSSQELTPNQFNILGIVKSFGGSANISSIKKELIITSPALTQILNRLEKNGLIKRDINKDNKREFIISITSKGLDLYDKLNEIYIKQSENILKNISKEDILNCMETLKKIQNLIPLHRVKIPWL